MINYMFFYVSQWIESHFQISDLRRIADRVWRIFKVHSTSWMRFYLFTRIDPPFPHIYCFVLPWTVLYMNFASCPKKIKGMMWLIYCVRRMASLNQSRIIFQFISVGYLSPWIILFLPMIYLRCRFWRIQFIISI